MEHLHVGMQSSMMGFMGESWDDHIYSRPNVTRNDD